MSSYGYTSSGGLATNLGVIVAAKGCNVFFTPLHFHSAVYGVQLQEKFAREYSLNIKQRIQERIAAGEDFKGERSEEEYKAKLMGNIAMVLLAASVYPLLIYAETGKELVEDLSNISSVVGSVVGGGEIEEGKQV